MSAEARTRGPEAIDGGPAQETPQVPSTAETSAPSRADRPLSAPSLAGSLQRFSQRLARGGTTLGAAGAATHQIGPLHFDPQGADFTDWVNHFSRELHRNVVLPQSVLMGVAEGDVQLGFVIGRDGSVADLVVLKSSGNSALDRASANALLSSRFLGLPADYRPEGLVAAITFHYRVRRS